MCEHGEGCACACVCKHRRGVSEHGKVCVFTAPLESCCLVVPPLHEHVAGIPLYEVPIPSGSEAWASCSQNQSQGLTEGSVLGLVLRGPTLVPFHHRQGPVLASG